MRQLFQGLRSALESGSLAISTNAVVTTVPIPAYTRAVPTPARWATAPQAALPSAKLP